MARYEAPAYAKTPSSTTSKVALGLGIGALGVNALGGGGIFGSLLGGPRPFGYPSTGFAAPVAAPAVFSESGCGYVTEKELRYVRENSTQATEIAKLKADAFTRDEVSAATAPLAAQICDLQKYVAVNEQRFEDYRVADTQRFDDFRRYVNSEFVHQPTARMDEVIVTCRQRGCDCGHEHRGRD